MIYLLDTNACIHHLKFADSPITRKLTIHLPETAVSSVTKAELFYGAMRSNNPTQSIREQDLKIEDWQVD
jgi:tRNA(fMet)-specific endonuclease VapC